VATLPPPACGLWFVPPQTFVGKFSPLLTGSNLNSWNGN